MSKIQKFNQEMGQSLVKAAVEQEKKEREAAVIGSVKRMIEMQQQFRESVARAQNGIHFLTKRIEALNAGEFSISRDTIIYEATELNDPRGVDLMPFGDRHSLG